MKKLTMFVLADCPYCRQALVWREELCREDARLAEVPVEVVDEAVHPGLADAYPYYYVPSFFLGQEKLFEGVPTKEAVRAALEAAMRA